MNLFSIYVLMLSTFDSSYHRSYVSNLYVKIQNHLLKLYAYYSYCILYNRFWNFI